MPRRTKVSVRRGMEAPSKLSVRPSVALCGPRTSLFVWAANTKLLRYAGRAEMVMHVYFHFLGTYKCPGRDKCYDLRTYFCSRLALNVNAGHVFLQIPIC